MSATWSDPMELDITRWATAVLVVAVPLAAAFARFARYDQRVNESFTTREDLVAHWLKVVGGWALG